MPIPPKSRMPLRYRAQYSDRVSVYRSGDYFADLGTYLRFWVVRWGADERRIRYFTYDEAVHEAHQIARVKAERDEQPPGECPPIEAVLLLRGVVPL